MARLGMDSMAPTKGHPDSACASLGLAMLGLLVLRREPSPAEAAPPHPTGAAKKVAAKAAAEQEARAAKRQRQRGAKPLTWP